MSDLHLAHPAWSHGLWLAAAFVFALLLLERRGTSVLERLLSPLMQQRLVSRPSRTRRILRCSLLGATCVLLIVALMRPQWGLYFERTPRAGTELMVCLDVSKSMLAEDVTPNRLERAKAEIVDLLGYLRGDHVGLIAFAGKATVLCPLTPDFSFLRLVLERAGPHSVSRGGTQLAAPILQAVEGFGGAGDVSRTILLITDGEDHDSFPIEAAEKAAERGIKIFTVGFGSEQGSEIMVSDRRSGARTLLTDGDGKPVSSRLDGETLREIALATEGAYIPAGTGTLDLDSIYRDLLAPLTRGQLDGRGRPRRKDGFQWAVLLALLSLLGAVAVTSGRPRTTMIQRSGIAALALLWALGAVTPASARDAGGPDPPTAAEAPPETPPETPPEPAAAEQSAEEPGADEALPEDPRETYNRGLELLASGQLDEAQRYLGGARQSAGSDGTARYRATYNLGWASVKRHDAILEQEPEKALQHLYDAAGWFRDAVRLRPEEIDARHNLEVVMRKAMALADALREDKDLDLAGRMDELIEQQREFVGRTRDLATRVRFSEDAGAEDTFRRDFRNLATEQRKILSDSGRIADDAAGERDAIESKDPDQRTPEENVRVAQLAAVLHYLHEAGERLGQTRRQLRQQRGERGCRRAAAGLRKLRRARDQLRDPLAILSALIEDAGEVADYTAALDPVQGLAGINVEPEDGAEEPVKVAAPPWLTLEYLQESQDELAQRGEELYTRLDAGLAGLDEEGAEAPQDPESQRFVEQLGEALPFIEQGQGGLRRAADELEQQHTDPALTEQRNAIAALLEARERFLDIRGLIELLFASQRQLQAFLTNEEADILEALGELRRLLLASEFKDMQRVDRLQRMLDEELAQIPPAAPPAAQDAAVDEAADEAQQEQQAQRQRLEVAGQLLASARQGMDTARVVFLKAQAPRGSPEERQSEPGASADDAADDQPADEPPANDEPVDDEPAQDALRDRAAGTAAAGEQVPGDPESTEVPNWVELAVPPVDHTVARLEELRRLFFSIIEHLRDTARRQQQLHGDAAEAAAMDEQLRPAAPGPLGPRQSELAAIAGELATALEEQSKQPPAGPPGAEVDPQQAQDMQDRLARAAELVFSAEGEMDQAAAGLDPPAPELDTVQQQQLTATEQLVAALRLLQDPQDQQQQNQQQDQQQQQQQQQQEKQDEQEDQRDLAQLLQAVRDREARRQAEKDDRSTQRYEPVDKDW